MERKGLTPGSEVGGYTIVAPLGSGGMGTVYRALDGGGTAVALKLLHGADDTDTEARERLRREVLALQRLRHPAVAAVLDAEADSTEAFIVTELVDGVNLEEHVREHGPLDAAALHEVAEGLRSALTAVHDAGVVHRDLKPSNVLVTEHGPVLIDFGIAHAADDARVTSTGLVIGTPGYLAPELLDGAAPAAGSDWWGWAALLAFAATGRAPFGLRPLEQVLARARAGDPDVTGAGPLTAGALRGALAADPADRLPPADVVAALQVAVADGDPADPADGDVAPDGDPGDAVATVLLTKQVAAPHDAGAAVAGAAADDDEADDDEYDDDEAYDDPAAHDDAQDTVLLGATGTAVGAVATTQVLMNDGNTRVLQAPVAAPAPAPAAPPPPSFAREPYPVPEDEDEDADDDDPGEDHPRAGWLDPLDGDPHGGADDEDDEDEPGYERPFARRRWGSLLALALLATASAALYPGWTLLVLGVLLVLVRTVGSTVEAMYSRRERVGVRRTDVLRAVVATPWHLALAVLGLLPAVVVAASVAIIVLGVVWWLVSGGYWAPGGVRGAEPEGIVESAMVAGVFVLALVCLWWGPLSRTTRTGARRVLSVVAPGRAGAFVLTLVALVVAAVLTLETLGDPQVVWAPLPQPRLP